MKKTVAILFIITISMINTGNAQKKEPSFRLGFGLNGGIPLKKTFDFSLGADIRLQYDISKKTSLATTTGYTNFFCKDNGNSGFVPAKLGFKSFFGDQFYVLGEVGAAIGTKSGMGTSFLWAPGIGVATKNIDVSLRYENYQKFNTGQISLRLAYGFKL